MTQIATEDDQVVIAEKYLNAFSQFVAIDDHLAFLEADRKLVKRGCMQSSFVKYLRKVVDCHIEIKAGNWVEAADILIELSSADSPLSEALSLPQKTALVEFAGYMVIIASLGSIFAPDYALFFLDYQTNFKKYYSLESVEEMQLQRKKSSLNRQNSKKKQKQELNENSTAVMLEDTKYYEETEEYKNLDVDEEYGEEIAPREIIERKVTGDLVQPSSHTQFAYKKVLQAVVKLLEQINSDELAFAYKLEYQRMYNLLMVCAVNDTQKTPDTCQLIA